MNTGLLQQMAEMTGLSLLVVKALLGETVTPEEAVTVEGALGFKSKAGARVCTQRGRQALGLAQTATSFEEGLAALKLVPRGDETTGLAVVRLLLPRITTCEEAHSARSACNGTGQSTKLVEERWEQIALKRIAALTTPAELKGLFTSSEQRLYRGGNAHLTAIQKLLGFVTDQHEAEEVFGYARGHPQARQETMDKWLSFLSKPAEVQRLFASMHLNEDAVRVRVLEKWLSLAETPEQVDEAVKAARGDEEQRKAIEKRLSFVTTAKEAMILHRTGRYGGGSLCQQLVDEKWADLSKVQLDAATTAAQAKEAYECSPHESTVQVSALQQWHLLAQVEADEAQTPEAAAAACQISPLGSAAQETAVRRLRQMLEAATATA